MAKYSGLPHGFSGQEMFYDLYLEYSEVIEYFQYSGFACDTETHFQRIYQGY